MPNRIGQRLGNYRLLRLLGAGGWASVYLGQHLYLNTQAAIKVLHAHMGSGDVERFYTEARAIAGLVHPHILRILDMGVEGGLPYLVMEYAPKGTVRHLHVRDARLPLVTVVSYVRQVAEALQFAHDEQIVHRDVKPENVLVGRGRTLLLGDFGLAVLAGQPSPAEAGGGPAIVGSLGYLAPEQFLGRPCAASDQYALGIAAYEWLTGDLPFSGTPDEIVDQHLVAPPPALRESNPDLSLVVEQVVLTALAKDPALRFPNVWDFAIALEEAASSSGTAAFPLSPFSRMGRGNARRALVGRASELMELRRLLRTFERHSPAASLSRSLAPPMLVETPRAPHTAVLLGEAGIGKTRLAEELSREARERGWTVAWSRGYEQESSIPYGPWREALRAAIAQSGWQGQELQDTPGVYQALATLLPEVAGWLPIEAVSLSTPAEQRWVWEAVFLCLTAIAERTPLLLVLDDLQWADSSSRDLLAYLARRLKQERILLVGTYRDTELEPTHPLPLLLEHLQREQAVLSLSIGPLGNEEIGTLLVRLPGQLPQALIERIQRLAAGNPFFAEELAHLSSFEGQNHDPFGAAGETALSARTSSTPSPSSAPVRQVLPATIASVLDLRLARLSPACRRLLSKAAVVGGSFDLALMRLMESSAPTDEGELLDLLDEALRARILVEESSEMRVTYNFRHPLLVSHLYDTLSAGRRSLFHRQAAEALQQVYAGREGEGAAAIAYHLVKGHAEPERIARYAELAGDAAYTLSAYPEAERHYRLALEQRGGKAAASTPEDKSSHAAALLERLAECMRVQGNYEEARRLYTQALEVYVQREGNVSESASEEEAQLRAMLWCAIGVTWYDTGDSLQARLCYERSEQVLRHAGVSGGPVWASLRFEQSYLSWRDGNYEEAYRTAQEAQALFEEALAHRQGDETLLARPTRLRRTLAGDPVDPGRVHMLLGLIALVVGQSAAAVVHWQTALAVFEEHRCLREIAIVCCNLGDVYLRKAEHTLARASFQHSLALTESIGDLSLQSVVSGNLGILAARQGDLVEAETWYRKSLLLADQINDSVYVSTLHVHLASTLQDQGKLVEAGEMLHRSIVLGRALHNLPSIGLALVALGRFRARQAMAAFGEYPSRGFRLLHRARRTLQHALACQGLEAETSTEGHILLAEISFLLGDEAEAYQQMLLPLEQARAYELTALTACAQRVLGNILTALGRCEEGDSQFEQALHTCRHTAMQLEYARTLRDFGAVLVQRDGARGEEYQHGVSYLQEARQMFAECQAVLDIHVTEQMLARFAA